MADKSQKTEKPTQKRLREARREGNFPTAKQFVAAAQFLVIVALIGRSGPEWFHETTRIFRRLIQAAFREDLAAADVCSICMKLFWAAFSPLLIWGGVVLLATLAAQFVVTRLGVSLKKAAPDLKRLSPLNRLRELPSQNLSALVQAVLLLPIFGGCVYAIAAEQFSNFMALPLASVPAGVGLVAGTMKEFLWKAACAFAVLGCVDFFRQSRKYQQNMMMSRQDIRDELKQIEGSPLLKARIRRLRRAMLRRRMMQDVPKATAVIVNPTHYAVAIRYVMGTMNAPVVVAKGQNYLAQRIRHKAMAHQVPLIENPPLARALYGSAEVGQEIPPNLYRVVAEILAYIHKIMQGRSRPASNRTAQGR